MMDSVQKTNVATLWSFLDTFELDSRAPQQAKHGFIARVHFNQCKRRHKDTIAKLLSLTGLPIKKDNLRSKIVSIANIIEKMSRHISRPNIWDDIVVELEKYFILPLTEVPTESLPFQSPSTSTVFTSPLPKRQRSSSIPKTSPKISPARVLRHDCKGCVFQKEKVSTLEKIIEHKEASFKNFQIKLQESNRKFKASHKKFIRKKEIEKSLRVKADAYRKRRNALSMKLNNIIDPFHASKQIRNSKIKITALERRLSKACSERDFVITENRNLKEQIRRLEDTNDFLHMLKAFEEDEINSIDVDNVTEKRVIDDRIRKIIYKSLEQNVPVHSTKPLLDYTFKCLGVHTSRVPSAATISRCAYEIGALADLQAAEFMMDAVSLTISWDATTLKGDHLNAIQVSSDTGIIAITTDKLPGGRSEDYAEHIVDAIRHTCDVYAIYHKRDPVDIFNTIVSKWKCTMSDRASVNHCTVEKLKSQLEIELIELNCNLHPLECVASTAREALLCHEKSMKPEASEPSLITKHGKRSECLGNSAGAVNLISAISKLRYKDGKGDPLGFKSFMAMNNINNRLLVRYVGNRLHELFHLGGSIYHIREQLLRYMEVCSQEKIRQAVKVDLQDVVILLHLQILGLFGKSVTAPWMSELYTDGSRREHLKLAWSLKGVLEFFKKCEDNPDILLESTTDAFGKQLLQTDLLDSLRKIPVGMMSSYRDAVTQVASQIYRKLSKQLAPYISGRLSQDVMHNDSRPSCSSTSLSATATESLEALTSSAPPHNMYAERALGMMDSLLRRAPSASIKTIDARVRARLNRTTDWIEELDTQGKLIAFARERGVKARKRNTVLEQRLNERIANRQKEKPQQREMKDRRKLERQIKEKMKLGCVADLFEDLDDARQKFVTELLSDKIGLSFRHVWATEDGTEDVYLGSLRKVKKDKLQIFYWKDEDSASSGVEYTIATHSLIADILLGDIIPTNEA